MRLNNQLLPTVLTALGEQISQRTKEYFALVVCGGSALQALGLVERTTRDVDVLAVVHRTAGDDASPLLLLSAEPLPPLLIEAAQEVQKDFNLPSDWLNAGPTDLLTEGLPEGCTERLHSFSYGEQLMIYFIDRTDQICLKTYAALNGDSQRHLADLRVLTPTEEEMLFAAQWTLTQDAADFFPDLVRDFLRKVGYPHVADRL
jgi:hypothetical protein